MPFLLLHNNDASRKLGPNGAAALYEPLALAAAEPGASLKEACNALIDATASPPKRDLVILLARTRAALLSDRVLDAARRLRDRWTGPQTRHKPAQGLGNR